SGTRQLATTNITLPGNTWCAVEADVDAQVRGGDPGPCYYQLQLTVNGNTRTSPGGDQGFWGVQGVPDRALWAHSGEIAGTGSAIAVTARIIWGAGGGCVYTDYGNLTVRVTPQR